MLERPAAVRDGFLMPLLAVAYDIAQQILTASDFPALQDALVYGGQAMGFDYFALQHHSIDASPKHRELRIHNYPREWETSYDRRQLGRADPIHRASQQRAAGFLWRDVPHLIPFGKRDEAMLREARQFGILDGFTVPSHVLGERPGSMTFAFAKGQGFSNEALLLAEGLGHLIFQKARMIVGQRPYLGTPRVTDRQLEIIILLGQDKINGEIADILSIKEDTVVKHVHNIFGRFDAVRRTSLPLRAVFEGLLIFSDILR